MKRLEAYNPNIKLYIITLEMEIKNMKKINKEVAWKVLQICILAIFNVWKTVTDLTDLEEK